MKYKTLIWIFVFIFSSIYIHATNIDTNLAHYWNLSNMEDSVGSADLTDSGTSADPTCKLDECREWTGNNALYRNNLGLSGSSYSIGMWAQSDVSQTSGDYNAMFRWWSGSGVDNSRNYWSGYANNDMRIKVYGVSASCDIQHVENIGTDWHYYVIVANASDDTATLYIDGEKDETCSFTGDPDDSSKNMYFGNRQTGGEAWDGSIDEIGIWEDALTLDQIELLYNSGDGCNPKNNPTGCIPDTTPSVSLYTNLTNNTVNFNWLGISYNYSGVVQNVDTDLVNVSFYVNEKFNGSHDNINITRNHRYNITISPSYTGWINLSFNVSNSQINSSSGLYYYNIDVVEPEINISTDFTNHSQYTVNVDSVILNVTFYDLNMFAYNVSIYDVNDNLQESISAQNLTCTLCTNYSTRVPMSIGNYSVKLEAWDSHTKNKIKDYKVNKLTDGLEFEDNIRIKGRDIKKSNFEKKEDRYEFSFELDSKKNWNEFTLESDSNLVYIPHSKYTGHFVDFTNKKWIDFESDNYEDIEIRKNSEKSYNIKVKTNKKKGPVVFKSIGDLNYKSQVYYYTVVEASTETTTTSINMTGVENKLEEIKEVMSMLPTFLLWFVTTSAGLYLMNKRRKVAGVIIFVFSFMFDLILNSYYMDTYLPQVGMSYSGILYGFLIFGLVAWLIGKVVIGITYFYKL